MQRKHIALFIIYIVAIAVCYDATMGIFRYIYDLNNFFMCSLIKLISANTI